MITSRREAVCGLRTPAVSGDDDCDRDDDNDNDDDDDDNFQKGGSVCGLRTPAVSGDPFQGTAGGAQPLPHHGAEEIRHQVRLLLLLPLPPRWPSG